MFDTLQTFIAPRLRSFLKLLSIGHFHKKRIVFFSYFGAQYSCNPKYISEYMQERHPDFEIIWAFKSPQNFSYLHDKGIKTVKYLHPYFLHVCLTSKFIVTNSEIPAWFPIMKRQVYINTWHGGGAYKRVGAAYQKETPGKQIRAEIARSIKVFIMTEPFFPAECRETICCSIMIILNCTIRSERTITSLQRQRSFYTPLLIGNQKRLLIIYSTARQFNLLFQKNLAATGLFYSVHTTLL